MSTGILFLEDWDKYPNAICHQTKNTTWLEMASKYKSMGVKNYYSHLALINPELAEYDPHDPYLDDRIKLEMIREAQNNPWYFYREIFRVPAKSGGGYTKFEANRGVIAAIWSVFNHFITYLQLIRQTGKSLFGRGTSVYWHKLIAKGSEHILFTKSDLRSGEIREYKKIAEGLPVWMLEPHPDDADNQIAYTTLSRGNVTKTYIPSNDPDGAQKIGRGTTPNLVIGDEIPFLTYADISIPALINATGASFEEAVKKDVFHAILYTTTAGDLSTRSGKYVYEFIKSRSMFFSEVLFDCKDRETAKKMIVTNRKGSDGFTAMVDISFNHRQLGKTDDWLRERMGRSPSSLDQIRMDYLNQWIYGGATNPITEADRDIITKSTRDPYSTHVTGNYYVIKHYREPEYIRSRKTVIGLDMSSALGSDSIAGVMVDVETGEVLLVFGISYTNVYVWGIWFCNFVKFYYNATVVIENKHNAQVMIDFFIIRLAELGIDIGRRFYSVVVDKARDSDRDVDRYKDYTDGAPSERKYRVYRDDFGFNTNKDLREDLFKRVLSLAVESTATAVRDPVLIDELMSLVVKNGRLDHKSGNHDDHVIAWLLTHWFLSTARNLSHYGIAQKDVYADVIGRKAPTQAEVKKKSRKEVLEKQIADILEKIENAATVIEARYYETQLKCLYSDLEALGIRTNPNSIDKVSREARDKKVATRRSIPTADLRGVRARITPFYR